MFIEDTKIKKKVAIADFKAIISKYSLDKIECTLHTFFRLSQKQRDIYTYDELKRILTTQTPFLAGLQCNDNYAIFYKYQGKNLKMILNIDKGKINIVTFYFIEEWQIPEL